MSDFKEWLKTTRGIIMSITAVIVVLPALINAFYDVYETALQIPEGIKERHNKALFEKHFQESPIFTKPMVINTGPAEMEMNIDIYENGDIFVRYGEYSQWFPINPDEIAFAGSFFRSTYAQAAIRPEGNYKQLEWTEGKNIVQRRRYENGVIETIKFNRNTGKIVERTVTMEKTAELPRELGETPREATGEPEPPPAGEGGMRPHEEIGETPRETMEEPEPPHLPEGEMTPPGESEEGYEAEPGPPVEAEERPAAPAETRQDVQWGQREVINLEEIRAQKKSP